MFTLDGFHSLSVYYEIIQCCYCRIRIIPGFYEPAECDSLLDALVHELPWQQETVTRGVGDTYVQPRMTAWFGDVPYSYSGITHPTDNQVISQ